MTASFFSRANFKAILPTQRKIRHVKRSLYLQHHYWARISFFCIIVIAIHVYYRLSRPQSSYFYLNPQYATRNVLHIPTEETVKSNALQACIGRPISKLKSFDPFMLALKQQGVHETSFENRFQEQVWDTLVGERLYPAWSDMTWNIPQYGQQLAVDLSILQWFAATSVGVSDKHNMELIPYRDRNSPVDIQNVHHRLDRYRGLQYVVSFKTTSPTNPSIPKPTLQTGVSSYTMFLERSLDSREENIVSCSISLMENTPSEKVYILLPYMGRVERLRLFMQNFRWLSERDPNIFLIVSILRSDIEGANTFAKLKEEIFSDSSSQVVQLDMNNGDADGIFNRGVALRDAARLITDGNSILFQCDVDMIVLPDFVDRCRKNSIQNWQVYYPTFYSLYPYANSRPEIIERNGFWRKTSFGMACMRKSDFEQVNAFVDAETRFRGWGSEDVYQFELVRNNTNLIAFRAVDSGLLHRWHSKTCDSLSTAYHDCMKTNFVTMGHPLRIGKALLESVTDVDTFFERLQEA